MLEHGSPAWVKAVEVAQRAGMWPWFAKNTTFSGAQVHVNLCEVSK